MKQLHLCSECASKLGSDNLLKSPPTDHFETFLSDFLGASRRQTSETKQCSLCGITERSILETGKVGCARCYETFSDMLAPYIKRIHSNTNHNGKAPVTAGPELKRKREIDTLKHQLDSAVEIEDFESAVIFRDKIKELEGGSAS